MVLLLAMLIFIFKVNKDFNLVCNIKNKNNIKNENLRIIKSGIIQCRDGFFHNNSKTVKVICDLNQNYFPIPNCKPKKCSLPLLNYELFKDKIITNCTSIKNKRIKGNCKLNTVVGYHFMLKNRTKLSEIRIVCQSNGKPNLRDVKVKNNICVLEESNNFQLDFLSNKTFCQIFQTEIKISTACELFAKNGYFFKDNLQNIVYNKSLVVKCNINGKTIPEKIEIDKHSCHFYDEEIENYFSYSKECIIKYNNSKRYLSGSCTIVADKWHYLKNGNERKKKMNFYCTENKKLNMKIILVHKGKMIFLISERMFCYDKFCKVRGY